MHQLVSNQEWVRIKQLEHYDIVNKFNFELVQFVNVRVRLY